MKKIMSVLCIGLFVFAGGPSPVSAAGPSSPEKGLSAFDPTHEIVCECECQGDTQTYEYFPNMACSRFDNIPCENENGFEGTLSGCTKKAQKIESLDEIEAGRMGVSRSSASPSIASLGRPIAIPEPVLEELDIIGGAEMGAWLDEISTTLFGTAFPGFVLDSHPDEVGQIYQGATAVSQMPFSFELTAINDSETVLGHVDPATFEVFDIHFSWVQGEISAGGARVSTGLIAVTATYVNDPTQQLTMLLPLGANYPFHLKSGFNFRSGRSSFNLNPFEKQLDARLSYMAGPTASCDACQGCIDTANRDIGRMKRDLKSCLKWAAAGGVVGGLLGLLGGNPLTVIGGAALAAEVVALACADTALATYGDIIEDFCACREKNDCPPHPVCEPTG